MLIPLEVHKDTRGQPYITRYKFCWALSGKIHNTAVTNIVVCNYVSVSPVLSGSYRSAPVEINKLWELENEGLDRCSMSVLDKKVVDLWDNNCRNVDRYYELVEDIPNNCILAQKDLNNLVKHLQCAGLYTKYDEEMTNLLN